MEHRFQFTSETLDDGGENLYLGYLRDSDEFRIAVANYFAYKNDLVGDFATWVLAWLLRQKKED